jgi:hypothetical protein
VTSSIRATTAFNTTHKVDLRRLKQYAMSKLPSYSPLREVLLAESDEVEAVEYLARLKTWLVLLRYSEERAEELSKT